MAHYTISNLKSALTAGGARPNMFQAKIDIPSSGKAWGIFDKEDQKTLNANKFLCKSTNIPAETVGVINVPFMGKDLKLTGDRTVDNWSATFINDEDFAIHKLMSNWSDAIYGNLNQMGKRNPNHYMGTIVVTQLMRETIDNVLTVQEMRDNKTKFGALQYATSQGVKPKDQTKQKFIEPSTDRGSMEWKMYDCWPVSVSAIDLSMDSTDSIEEFTVEFAIQSFEIMQIDNKEKEMHLGEAKKWAKKFGWAKNSAKSTSGNVLGF